MQELNLGLCDMSVEVDGITLECDNPATVKIMGERDSFGCEWIHCCDGCAATLRKEIAEARDRAEAAAALKPCVNCGAHGPQAQVSLCRHELQPWEDAYSACQSCQDFWHEEDMLEVYGRKCEKCGNRSHSTQEDYESGFQVVCDPCWRELLQERTEKQGEECAWCYERSHTNERVQQSGWSADNYLVLCADCIVRWHAEEVPA